MIGLRAKNVKFRFRSCALFFRQIEPQPRVRSEKGERDTKIGGETLRKNLNYCFVQGAQEITKRAWWVEIISEVTLQRLKGVLKNDKRGSP